MTTALTHRMYIQGQMGVSTSAGKQDWSPSPGEQNLHLGYLLLADNVAHSWMACML